MRPPNSQRLDVPVIRPEFQAEAVPERQDELKESHAGLITIDQRTTVGRQHGSGQSRQSACSSCPNCSPSHAAGDRGVVRPGWGLAPTSMSSSNHLPDPPVFLEYHRQVHPFTGVHSRGCLPGVPRAPSPCQPHRRCCRPDRSRAIWPASWATPRTGCWTPAPPTAPSCSGPSPMRAWDSMLIVDPFTVPVLVLVIAASRCSTAPAPGAVFLRGRSSRNSCCKRKRDGQTVRCQSGLVEDHLNTPVDAVSPPSGSFLVAAVGCSRRSRPSNGLVFRGSGTGGEEPGPRTTRLTVKPFIANLVLWKTIYEHGGHYYTHEKPMNAGFHIDSSEGRTFRPATVDGRI